MRLYNTASRKIEEVNPLNPGSTTVYTCGPTVYDYPHIGNWFTFIRYDLLIRTLKNAGLNPKWVMNITDVGHLVSDADEGEDKLEKGARREGKTAWDVAKYYGDYFIGALQRVNMLKPDYLPRATELIEEQINLVNVLEEKGFTYVIVDGVYFDTSKLDDYGKLARLDKEHLKEGARVEVNQQKKNPTDFAVWKFSPKDEKRDMEWESPWGKGFPGWHLECSIMAMKYLGNTIDIHAGGIDHIPVHHTNEIAQSEAATGQIFANYWMHANFILVDGKKMSKSQDNFYTLEDIEEKRFDLEAFRLLVLESHYRTEANFSWEALEAAQNRLNSFRAAADLVFQPVKSGSQPSLVEGDFETYIQNINSALEDDLNTPIALKEINSVVDFLQNIPLEEDQVIYFKKFLEYVDKALGLNLSNREDISAEQKEMLADRQDARSKQSWEKSDEIRQELAAQGIKVRDTSTGQIWEKI